MWQLLYQLGHLVSFPPYYKLISMKILRSAVTNSSLVCVYHVPNMYIMWLTCVYHVTKCCACNPLESIQSLHSVCSMVIGYWNYDSPCLWHSLVNWVGRRCHESAFYTSYFIASYSSTYPKSLCISPVIVSLVECWNNEWWVLWILIN